MTTTKKHIESAFELISTIPVRGDAVDVMAQVRNELRLAYQTLQALETEHPKNSESPADKEAGEDG